MNNDRLVPLMSTISARIMVRFRPSVCMRPAMNGPISPIRMMLTDTAPEIVLTSQPNARRSGPIITPGAARTLTPASIDMKTRPRTTQA